MMNFNLNTHPDITHSHFLTQIGSNWPETYPNQKVPLSLCKEGKARRHELHFPQRTSTFPTGFKGKSNRKRSSGLSRPEGPRLRDVDSNWVESEEKSREKWTGISVIEQTASDLWTPEREQSIKPDWTKRTCYQSRYALMNS